VLLVWRRPARQNKVAFAVLKGRSSEQVRIPWRLARQYRDSRVTPSLPPQLLTARPNIREAETNLAAADGDVYNARSAFVPRITRGGDGGYKERRAQGAAAAGIGALLGRRWPGAADHGSELLANLDLQ
jgi:outer membrane protein TolC